MNVSNEDARQSLAAISDTKARTYKSIAAAYTGPSLILWGAIWIAAFLGTHFFLAWVWHIWMSLSGLGVIATFLICWRQFRAGTPTRSVDSKKIGWRIFWFWSLLFTYLFIWLKIFSPFSGLQCNAFICTTVMFAFVITGLWMESRFMVWLGLAVTATTLVGFYLIDHSYYCLWMALTAGGALLGTGLYIRLRWR